MTEEKLDIMGIDIENFTFSMPDFKGIFPTYIESITQHKKTIPKSKGSDETVTKRGMLIQHNGYSDPHFYSVSFTKAKQLAPGCDFGCYIDALDELGVVEHYKLDKRSGFTLPQMTGKKKLRIGLDWETVGHGKYARSAVMPVALYTLDDEEIATREYIRPEFNKDSNSNSSAPDTSSNELSEDDITEILDIIGAQGDSIDAKDYVKKAVKGKKGHLFKKFTENKQFLLDNTYIIEEDGKITRAA